MRGGEKNDRQKDKFTTKPQRNPPQGPGILIAKFLLPCYTHPKHLFLSTPAKEWVSK